MKIEIELPAVIPQKPKKSLQIQYFNVFLTFLCLFSKVGQKMWSRYIFPYVKYQYLS